MQDIERYVTELNRTIEQINLKSWSDGINRLVEHIKSGKHLFTCGNGGSANTASHYVTDWSKMTYLSTQEPARVFCLCDQIGVVTAYGNDNGYDKIYSLQLEQYLTDDSALLVVSGSGNSQNILEVLKVANEKGLHCYGVLGFDGGKALDLCDTVFHVPSRDMQICEDIHMIFGHMVMKRLTA